MFHGLLHLGVHLVACVPGPEVGHLVGASAAVVAVDEVGKLFGTKFYMVGSIWANIYIW